MDFLFRGKRKDNGEWIEGGFADIGSKKYIIPKYFENIETNEIKFFEIESKTKTMWTGTEEKKFGRKIFEGDIIQCSRMAIESLWTPDILVPEISNYVIKLSHDIGEGYFFYAERIKWEYKGQIFNKKWQMNNDDPKYMDDISTLKESYKVKVIGNIFDNTNLLNGYEDVSWDEEYKRLSKKSK